MCEGLTGGAGRGCLEGPLPGQPFHTGVLPAPTCPWAAPPAGAVHRRDQGEGHFLSGRFPAPEPALIQKAENPGGPRMLGDGQICRCDSHPRRRLHSSTEQVICQGCGNVK